MIPIYNSKNKILLEEIYCEMPDVFSQKTFTEMAHSRGFPKSLTFIGCIGSFLTSKKLKTIPLRTFFVKKHAEVYFCHDDLKD